GAACIGLSTSRSDTGWGVKIVGNHKCLPLFTSTSCAATKMLRPFVGKSQDYDGGGIPSDGGWVAQGRQACCSRCGHTYTARVNGRRVNVWFGRQGSRYRPSVQTDDLNHTCLVTNKCPTRSFVDNVLVDLALHGYDLQHTPRIGIQTWPVGHCQLAKLRR
ncbi:hypothetical protein SB861_47850, partial [Paraburkholderia sp. SIMBA_049]